MTEELAEPLYHLSLVLEEESDDVLCPELQHQFILLSEMLMNSLWLKATMPSDALEWDEGASPCVAGTKYTSNAGWFGGSQTRRTTFVPSA